MKLIPAQPGHLVGAAFGFVFVLLNSTGLGSPGRTIAIVLAALLAAVVLFAFIRGGKPARPENQSTQGYFVIVAIEVVFLFGGLRVINDVEPAAAAAWIALVVGMHFVAFSVWWLRGNREMFVIGVLMTVLAVIGLVIAFTQHDESLVDLIAGFGSGVVLLGSAALYVFGGTKSREKVPSR
ncbi:hypothetical protein [Kribbella deserti]|uniref:DUF308 domain-containing protein n=1 Tax=Kribbella deserti TaxID=1926257 RepID=A0ABV6QW23_9ACTN